MANPQKENGFVPVANDIYDAFCRTRISGEARQVLDLIVRKTYGFNKKMDKISLSQFVEHTGLKKPQICRALAKLVTAKIIVGKSGNGAKDVNSYGLNKNYDIWVPLANLVTSVGKSGNAKKRKPLRHIEVPLANLLPTKDSNTKDTITKDSSARKQKRVEQVSKEPTPKEEAIRFFEGVKDLIEKKEVPWLKEMLGRLSENNPEVSKAKIWNEVIKFCSYWTEREQEGRRERWQIEKTFEVLKRLVTWFGRAGSKEFQTGGNGGRKGRGLVE